MADLPLVSVLMPCYNYACYVGDAIRSVLAQDYPNLELIIVDDGSSDDSPAVITDALQNRALGHHVHAHFIQQLNAGVSAALNAALAQAKGTYIATFDADDLMAAGRLSKQVHYLMAHPEVGCLGGRTIRIDHDGQPLPSKTKRRPVERYDFAKALASALVVGGNIAVYRRDAIDRAGAYDPAIRIQDFQMTLKVAQAGYFIDILPDVVTLYRKHGASLSSDYKSEYAYGLDVIAPYSSHPAYQSARARLVTKALRAACTEDKRYAWALVRQVPLWHWDWQLVKRLRHLLFKRSRRSHGCDR
jgi:alpha-1,6-rhamnosyltransferase